MQKNMANLLQKSNNIGSLHGFTEHPFLAVFKTLCFQK